MDTPSPSSSSSFQVDLLPHEWSGLLYEVTRHFASSLELDEVLGKVLSLTIQAVGASEGSIFLLNEDGQVNRSILARTNLPPTINHDPVSTVMSRGFAGWVYQHRKGDIIFDTESDDRWHVFPDQTSLRRSAMATPLWRRGNVIGIMTLMHPEPNGFTPKHLLLLEIIAGQAASAIENAAMYTLTNNERMKLQAIINAVQDIIVVTDLQDHLILANPAAQRNLGPFSNAYGYPIDEVINEAAFIDFYYSAANEKKAVREVTLEDGRVYNISMAQIPDVGRVIALHDITTFKKLDSLKSQFVSQVSHDLKAPLAVMQGYVWLLSQMSGLGDEANQYIQQIYNSIERMMTLINNVLDLGKIDMGIKVDFQKVDVVEIVRNTIDHMRPLATNGQVILTSDFSEETLPVLGSAIQIDRAISNLLGNAIKFTPSGGLVKILAGLEDSQVVVRVIDTGPGIPPALQAKLFQKFSKLNRAATKEREGHGLGLAITKSIIDAHKGRVWVESQEGKGSTFAFSLPYYSTPEPS
jgi:signal transduction histidine kinase